MAEITTERAYLANLTDDDHSSHSADRLRAARAIMNQTVPVLLLVLGTSGNTMTLVLFCKRKLSVFNFFFIVLAVSDTCVLYTGLLPRFIDKVADFHTKNTNIVFCKLGLIGYNVCGLLSAWTVVAMTSQRAASVIWPHRVNLVCTTRKAAICVICVTGISLVMVSHVVYYSEIVHQNGTDKCTIIETPFEYRTFVFKVLPWISTMLYALLPSALLVVSNSVLVWKVSRSVRKARGTMATGQAGQVDSRAKKASSMTLTLIAVSVTFFLLTMPLAVYSIVVNYTAQDPNMGEAAREVYRLVYDIVFLMWYANSAVNFYLYCLTGTQFRQQMRELFCVK